MRVYVNEKQNKQKTSWPPSASELYRKSDRRFSTKLVATFADRWCRVVIATDSYGRNLGFLDRSRYFSSKQLLSCNHQAEWTLFRTHYFSENLAATGIEPGPLDM
jgi:hypothetical protein